MNREALRRILERTRGAGAVALADPPATGVTPGHSREAVADPTPWEPLTRPQDPRERLMHYLKTRASMDETVWPDANVRALYEDIMDIFTAHPEADTWFKAWRAKHPEARW